MKCFDEILHLELHGKLRAMKSLIPLFGAVCVSLDFAQAKPNLVFIIADDLTFRDIGCYGGQAHTPNIDFLATEGMLFSCFQSSSMCSRTPQHLYGLVSI